MAEFFNHVPAGVIAPDFPLESVAASEPDQLVRLAKYTSHLIRVDALNPRDVLAGFFDYLEDATRLEDQARALLFLTCLEEKPTLWPGTQEFLDELRVNHGFDGEYTRPFQRFVSQRLRILTEPHAQKGYEDVEGTQKVLDLMRHNHDFFIDLLVLQEYFTRHISPVMPLNATWNPELTEQFQQKSAVGLWYIYAHHLGMEYVELLQKHLSSEWTGFNRFMGESWDVLRDKIDLGGSLVDIGSSIGITAIEIAQALNMTGPIFLLDYYNPYRNTSSLRIIDYANPQQRLIPFNEALVRMEALRGSKVVVQLFNVDSGKPFPKDIKGYIRDAALVHMGNLLPYIPRQKLYQTILNALEITCREGGILKIHNDHALPTDSLLTSLSIQLNGDRVTILRDLVKGHFHLDWP